MERWRLPVPVFFVSVTHEPTRFPRSLLLRWWNAWLECGRQGRCQATGSLGVELQLAPGEMRTFYRSIEKVEAVTEMLKTIE